MSKNAKKEGRARASCRMEQKAGSKTGHCYPYSGGVLFNCQIANWAWSHVNTHSGASQQTPGKRAQAINAAKQNSKATHPSAAKRQCAHLLAKPSNSFLWPQ